MYIINIDFILVSLALIDIQDNLDYLEIKKSAQIIQAMQQCTKMLQKETSSLLV